MYRVWLRTTTVQDTYCYYKVYYHNRLRWTVVMQPSYYHRIPVFVDELHAAQVREIEREIGSDAQPLVRFSINCTSKTMNMAVPEVVKAHIHVEFSIDPAKRLGFKVGVKNAVTYDLTGEKKFDLTSNPNTFYVYCDVVEPCLVVDTKFFLQDRKKQKARLSHIQPFTVRARAAEVLRHHRD